MRPADAHRARALEPAENSAGAGDGHAQVLAPVHVDRNAHARKVIRAVRKDQVDVLGRPARQGQAGLPEQFVAGVVSEVRPDRERTVCALEHEARFVDVNVHPVACHCEVQRGDVQRLRVLAELRAVGVAPLPAVA